MSRKPISMSKFQIISPKLEHLSQREGKTSEKWAALSFTWHSVSRKCFSKTYLKNYSKESTTYLGKPEIKAMLSWWDSLHMYSEMDLTLKYYFDLLL